MRRPAQPALARRLERYETLVDLLGALAAARRTEDVIGAVHEQANRLFGATITLYAAQQPDGHWRVRLHEGRSVQDTTAISNPEGLLERVLQGRVELIGDVAAYIREQGATARRLNRNAPPTRAWMGVPVRVRGETVGVLSLQSYEVNRFTPEDLEFLRLLGTHVALAVENTRLRERLEREASTDDLTGLLNRRAFRAHREEALRRADVGGAPLTLLLLRVDGMRDLSQYGLSIGDDALARVAERLRAHLTPHAQAYRLTRSEFAVIADLPEPQARVVAHALTADLNAQRWSSAPLRAHVGVAVWSSGQDADDWYVAADQDARRQE
ncbi:GGDEF domain-containing protein [Deinococcus maricopensis]|uniref:GGDEF domain-containing protein n=1 Tax=Deinococcus maricopensis TaxID=309887 RepID=UPI0002F85FDF|nr:diguanylate cyclase [Deinococcus maricopensis]